MKTYQDYQQASNLGAFIQAAVNELRTSKEYRLAQDAEAYYAKHNITMEKFQKWLYTVSGNKVADIFSANYKLKTQFFRKAVIQLTQYVLGNGINVGDEKELLGSDFDMRMQDLGKHSLVQGVNFGFWNYDHLERFSLVNTKHTPGFCPLYDAENGELKAGIRFWYMKQRTNDTTDILNFYTLYTVDGYIQYQGKNNETPIATSGLTPYKITTATTVRDGVITQTGSNYGTLPIWPLWANDTHESELVGLRENIDCYDFIKSGLGNDIDDMSGFFWIIKNAGAMDDPDLAQFIHRMKTVRATMTQDDIDVDVHTVDIPVEARKTMLEIIKRDLYDDAQILDVSTLSAQAKTAQEIQAAYQAQDNRAADFEYQLLDFLDKLFKLIGIETEPTFQWQKVSNIMEQTQMVIMSAPYISEEAVINHLPFLTPEEKEAEIANITLGELDRNGLTTE